MHVIRLVALGGPAIGHGHIARAIALGGALARRGAVVELELLAGTLTPGELSRARTAGLVVVEGGASQGPAEFVVLDVPNPTAEASRYAPDRLLVFDDRDAFAGRAAVVVQPSQPAWSGPGEAGTVLAGYRYVPLDAAYGERRGMAAPTRVSDPVRSRVVVCFGGSDPADVTNRVAGALADATPSLEVVVGASYHGTFAGGAAALVRDPVDLPDRLAAADLAIVGAGTMKFEVACLGRPAVLLAVADDQLPVGPPYAATGAAAYLGDGRTISPAAVAAAVQGLLADKVRLEAMGRTAAELVDGRGADRIADAILSSARPVPRRTA